MNLLVKPCDNAKRQLWKACYYLFINKIICY